MLFYRIAANPRSEMMLRAAWRIGAAAIAIALAAQLYMLISTQRGTHAAERAVKALSAEELQLRHENRSVQDKLRGRMSLDDKLDGDQYLASFVHQIGNLATDTSVNLITVAAEDSSAPVTAAAAGESAGAKKPAGPIWEITPVTVQVSGKFSDLLGFLDGLCSLPRPVETVDIVLQLGSIDPAAGRVSEQMTARLCLHRMVEGRKS